MSDTKTVAAVDLGSNSFHMVLARVGDGQVQIIDRIKEMVRLAGGLEDDKTLSSEARERALECLSRFGERLRGVNTQNVRAVGTNTLRKARDPLAFLEELQGALGHPVEIISGLEEARLVYLGVAHTVEPTDGHRLVIDIGGGSTEFVIGEGFEPLVRESKFMGCVGFTRRFFADGKADENSFEQAILAAKQEVELLVPAFRRVGWDEAFGSSGTNKAACTIAEEMGWSRGVLTHKGLQKIKDRVIRDGEANPGRLRGLSERRAPVFPAGLAILIAIFEILELDGMVPSDGALREGLLFDLLGRMDREDIRERTVAVMATRYGVDQVQAERVENTAVGLLHQVRDAWELDSDYLESLLRWACQLHEIGLAISHSRFHKHGSYLVENSDMPGFSRQDQHLLWAMVRSHRRSFKPHRFQNAPGDLPTQGLRLSVLLRLAIRLNRSRLDDQVPDLKLVARDDTLSLVFPEGWLESMPLTRAVLEEEAAYLKSGGVKLTW